MRRFRKKRQLHHLARDMMRFIHGNGQLLLMLLMILAGAFLGTIVYGGLKGTEHEVFSSFLSELTLPSDLMAGCKAVLSSAFGLCVILVLLFLFGMTAFGCPLIFVMVFVFGFWLGIDQSHAYIHGGYAAVIITVLSHMLVACISVLRGAQQALHMSCVFSRQLLPSGAHCGGMWQDFKKYLVSFLICMILALSSGIVQVLSRLAYQMI